MSDFKTRIAEIQTLRAEAYKGTHNDRYDILELCKAIDWLIEHAVEPVELAVALPDAVTSDQQANFYAAVGGVTGFGPTVKF